MSRSRELAAAIGVGALVLSLVLGAATVAQAGPVRSDAPVRKITALVLDIVVTTSDLGGGTRTDESRTRIAVTLSAETYFPRDSPRLRAGARNQLREVTADLLRRGPGKYGSSVTPTTSGARREVWCCRGSAPTPSPGSSAADSRRRSTPSRFSAAARRIPPSRTLPKRTAD